MDADSRAKPISSRVRAKFFRSKPCTTAAGPDIKDNEAKRGRKIRACARRELQASRSSPGRPARSFESKLAARSSNRNHSNSPQGSTCGRHSGTEIPEGFSNLKRSFLIIDELCPGPCFGASPQGGVRECASPERIGWVNQRN